MAADDLDSARHHAEETDRIIGLEMGADDYVVKPFSPRKLLARIKAVLRRSRAVPQRVGEAAHILVFEGWRLDLTKREVYTPETVLLPLTAGEFDLLAAFAEHPHRVLSRDQLLDLTKGRAAGAYDRSIDVQLSRLRTLAHLRTQFLTRSRQRWRSPKKSP